MSILVTGGSKGVGHATCLRFATPDEDVFINYHTDEGAARRTFDEVKDRGARPHLVQADMGTVEGAGRPSLPSER